MKKLTVVETYEREMFEVHERGHDGSWRRIATSPFFKDQPESECLKAVINSVNIVKGGTENLAGFLPDELCRVGKLRLCRVKRHVEILSFPVKLAVSRLRRK